MKKLQRKRLRTASADEFDASNGSNSSSSSSGSTENQYLREVNKLRKTIDNWDDMFCDEAETSRIEQMIRVEVIGQSLCDKYAWAIPDERSLRILSNFAPLIEIGAGRGYWAHLLQQRGVDIIAFDKKKISKESKLNWTQVQPGGPEILLDSAQSGSRNLFLCYPDEANSLAVKCLENYSGDYIIHVGELVIGGGGCGTLSSPQAPWGRTSSADFQVLLAEEFHCLLTVALPRFPFSNDCLSVWKRTKWVEGKPDAESGEDGVDSSEAETSDSKDNLWASIPAAERLPVDRAAPCLEHLL